MKWKIPEQMRKTTGKKSAVALTIILLVSAIPVMSYASNTQQQIDKAQQEKDALEGKLEDTNQDLAGMKDEKNTLRGRLNNLNAQLTEVSDNLADLEEQIKDKEQEITDTQAALEEARATEEWQHDCIIRRMRSMYENNEVDYLGAILSASSMAQLLNMADYMEQIAEYDQRMLKEYEANRQLIEEQELILWQEKEELEGLKVKAEAEKSKVAGLISQTANSISAYEDQISDAEAAALAYEAEIKKTEEDLEYLKKKLAEEIAMSKKAAGSVWRDISEVSFEEGDRYLLANLIYCEAGGESYEGQVAVGAVVVNRVLSSVYPDTVVGVIYQSKQFSPVGSGRLALALAENKATANCYRAAEQAMSGVTNVGNCVYFRTPVDGLSGISIGGHVFY